MARPIPGGFAWKTKHLLAKSPAGSANERLVAAGSCKIARSHELWYHGYNIKGGLIQVVKEVKKLR